MLLLLAVVHATLFVILLSNLRYLNRLRDADPPAVWPSVTVFIPARNEESNLQRLLPTLLNQQYDEFDVVVYDDGSTDGTWDVIQSFSTREVDGEAGVRGIRGDGPPAGWVGKVHALFQATRNASSDLYLFLDADGEFRHDNALKQLVQTLLAQPRNSVLTAITRLCGGGRLLVSYVPFAILATIPWSLQRRTPAQLGALNGQLWLIRGEDYRRLEPHENHPSEILEDVQIGRFLKRNGIIPVLYDAQPDFNVYMYPSFTAAWQGFKKNAYLILGGTPVSMIVIGSFYLVTFVLAPFFSIWLLVSLYLMKWISDLRTGFGPLVTLGTPLGFFLSFVIQLDSAVAHWRKRVSWKNRLVGYDN